MKIRLVSILLDPLAEAGGGPATQAPAQAAEPAPIQGGTARDIEFNPSNEPASSGAGGAAPQGQGSASGVPEVGGQGGRGGEEGWSSVVDAARELGYDFGGQQFADDRQFLLHLLNNAQANRQADYYAQLGRAIAPHYQGVQGYLQQQQAGAQQPQGRQPWEAPEFDEQWLALVDRDPNTGVFLAKPGVNPQIADKVNEFARWRDRFTSNPIGAIRPFVEQNLPNLVQQQVQQMMQQYQAQQEVNGIVRENAHWMYQHDEQGRPVIGVGGRQVPTPNGARYMQIVQELESQGLRSPGAVDRFARQILMGEIARNQAQAGSQPAPAAQASNALASSRSQRNVLQGLAPQQRQQTAGATEPDQAGMSLQDRLRQAFDQAGYSDADFRDPELLMA